MKQAVVIVALMIGGILAWLLGSRLSSDALGMAVGMTFGMLAGIPTVLLILADNQRRREQDDDDGQPSTVNVYITHNTDNRQLTINTGAQGMPLLADRERELARR